MTQISKAVEGVRQAAIAALTDAELLSCFLERRDGAAFAALVQRHGPMVWSICRRLLSQEDAEDAFQAVFIVLFRRAASIKPRKMLPAWLHGVARQTSLHTRRAVARRRTRERQVPMLESAATETDQQAELRSVLDAELSRLPDHYRAVLVLCDLQGKTRKEAARQLGCPEGTVAGHLARGRAMLARRLRRHSLGVSGVAFPGVLYQQAAAVSPSIVSRTVATVLGQAAAKVVFLAEGVIKAMLVTKVKKTLAVVLVLFLAVTGASVLTSHSAGPDDTKPAVEKRVEPAATQKKEPFAAWGDVVGGLQAGLGFRPGEPQVYNSNVFGKATLVVQVRNVGNKDVRFQYSPEFVWQELPDVTDANGKPIAVVGGLLPVAGTWKEVKLAPGKSIDLYEFALRLMAESERTKPTVPTAPYATLYGPGKFIIQYKRVAGDWSTLEPPTLSKIGTGKLELQVKPASP